MLLNFILKNGGNGKLHIMYILLHFFKAHEEMLKVWETGKERKGVGVQLIGSGGKI